MTPSNLFEAVERGDVDAVAVLVAAGADLDEIDLHQYQSTPLAQACTRGDARMVAALLAAGALPDFGAFTTPLVAAATYGFAELVDTLLAAGADVDGADESGVTALNIAAALGFAAIARRLVDAGADRNLADHDGRTPAVAALDNGHDALAAYLENPGSVAADAALWRDGETLAAQAARQQREEIDTPTAAGDEPRWRIKGGMASYRVEGATITQDFNGVAGSGNLELAAAMMDSGLAADWTMFRGHATALMTAARAGEEPMVALLLSRGADVRTTDEQGQTALHFALFKPSVRRHGPVLARLLAAGADPNAADGRGQRPLHLALGHAHPALIEALVAAGADPWLRDRAGRCPADWAPTTGKNAAAIARLLGSAD